MTTICQKAIKDKYITQGPSIQYVHGELFRFHQHYNFKKVVSVLLDHGSHFSDPLLNFYFLKPLKFCGLWRKSIWTDGISIVGAPPKKDRLRNTAANMVNQNITIR